MRFNKRFWGILAAVVLLVTVIGGGLLLAERPLDVFAGQGITEAEEDRLEGPDQPITDEQTLERASQAALDYVGEGRVTGTEVGDEEGYYEIEVTLDNGRQVDVHLNEAFEVLSQIDDVEND